MDELGNKEAVRKEGNSKRRITLPPLLPSEWTPPQLLYPFLPANLPASTSLEPILSRFAELFRESSWMTLPHPTTNIFKRRRREVDDEDAKLCSPSNDGKNTKAVENQSATENPIDQPLCELSDHSLSKLAGESPVDRMDVNLDDLVQMDMGEAHDWSTEMFEIPSDTLAMNVDDDSPLDMLSPPDISEADSRQQLNLMDSIPSGKPGDEAVVTVLPEESFVATNQATSLWGVAQGSDETELDAQYAAAEAHGHAIKRCVEADKSMQFVIEWDSAPNVAQKLAFDVNNVWKLREKDFPRHQEASEEVVRQAHEIVIEETAITRSINILRYVISEIGEDGIGRLNVKKLLDPRAALLRTFTADFNIMYPGDFQPSSRQNALEILQRNVPAAVKFLLTKKETRTHYYASDHNDGDGDGRQRHLRARSSRAADSLFALPTSTSPAPALPAPMALRQIIEDKVKWYCLWKARNKIMTNKEFSDEPHQFFGDLNIQVPDTATKYMTTELHNIVNPIQYRQKTLNMDVKQLSTDVVLNWMNVSFDSAYIDRDPYRPVTRSIHHNESSGSPSVVTEVHAPIAWTFFGVSTRPSISHLSRQFKLDFRTGIFEAHYYMVYKSTYSGQNPTFSGAGGIAYSRKHMGSRLGGQNPGSIIAGAANRNRGHVSGASTPSGSVIGENLLGSGMQSSETCGAQSIYGAWKVMAPTSPALIEAFRNRVPANDMNDGGSAEGAEDTSNHPSEMFDTPETLSLAEWCPIALFEHSSTPVLVANLGMMGRVTRYYRPSRESFAAVAQAERKVRGRLGFFGPLHLLGDAVLTLLGSPFRVKPNQGVAFFKSTLLRGPCFAHPFDPRRPLPTPENYRDYMSQRRQPLTPRQGWETLSHSTDYRLTDFLLIRTRLGQAAATPANAPQVKLTLRPLFYGYSLSTSSHHNLNHHHMVGFGNQPQLTNDNADLYGSASEEMVDIIESVARVGMYTLGQCELLSEVPAPDSKKVSEIRKEWLKAYALRFAGQGVEDFGGNKSKCCTKFGGIFDQAMINRFLIGLKKTTTTSGHGATAGGLSASGLTATAGMVIKPVSESSLRKLVTPEQICGLEACLAGNAYLSWSGIRYKKSLERHPVARAILQQQEVCGEVFWAKARGQFKAFMLANGESNGLSPPLPRLLKHPLPFRALLPHFTVSVSAMARVIEEMLTMTPWSQQKAYAEVTSKKNSQFLLGSIFDFSMGRYEGLCFLKEDVATIATRDPLLMQYRNRDMDRSFLVFEEVKREKGENLTMAELQIALLRVGLRGTEIWRLSRSELVNLYSRLQFLTAPKDTLLSLGGQAQRLDLCDYISRVNEILMRQRSALQIDDLKADAKPDDKSDIFQEALQPSLDQTALEESFLEDLDGLDHGEKSSPTVTPPCGPPTHDIWQAMKDIAWNDRLVTKPGVQIVHGGDLIQIENEEFEKTRERLANSSSSPYPYTNGTVATIAQRWLQGLPEKSIRDFLKEKQSCAVPRLKWVRSRPHITGGPNSEKVVYIYGEDNIEKFIAWRSKRIQEKRLNKQSVNHGMGAGASSKTSSGRTCRRCGQSGHISSNPNCPAALGGITGTVSGRQSGPSTSQVRKTESGEEFRSMVATDSEDGGGIELRGGGLPSTSMRLTARQSRLLYDKHKELESKGKESVDCLIKFQGTRDLALEELNQCFSRVVHGLKRPEKKFNWFWDAVKETEAPKYYQIVKEPMWLGKISEKSRDKEYMKIDEFTHDIDLIHQNCYAYNPEGHWIRPIADSLKETVSQKLEYQIYWLKELENYISKNE